MATDVEKLVVQLSADFKSFEREVARQNGVANRQFRSIENRARQMNKNLDGILARSMDGLKASVAGIGAAFATTELIRLADSWTDMSSRVDLAAGSVENGRVVMGRLVEMARRTYSPLQQTADAYIQNAQSLTELGYTTKTQLDYTESLNNALVISGAKGDRARSIMDALSKAMAGGKLSGDGLNTVIETGGRVAQALADSMGVTRAELRQLGADGKITRKELVGITSQLGKLRDEAGSMAATVGDATVILKDALLVYVGTGDQATGVTRQLSDAILLLADNFDSVADPALQLAFVIISSLIGRALVGMISTLPKAVIGMNALIVAMRAGTVTAAGLTAAIGPVGLLAGAAAATLYILATRQTEAERAAVEHEKSIQALKVAIGEIDYANQDAVSSTRQKIEADIEAARTALNRAEAELKLAESLQEVRAQQQIRNPSSGSIIGSGVNTGVLPTGIGQAMSNDATRQLTDSVVDGRVDAAKKSIEELRGRLEEYKSVETEFEDYASGRKRPARDNPIDLSGSDDKSSKARKERLDDYQRLVKRISDSTAATIAETEAQRQINPLIDDYGYALEKARAEQELLTAAKEAGKQITPELRKEIEQLADGYAVATVEAAKLGESQDDIRRRAEEMRDFQKDATRGIVDGFLQGKKAADVFADALSKVGNKLLDLAFDSGFGGKGGGFSLGNLLSGLFGGGAKADPWAGLRGYSTGGYTGAGGKYQPAGTVHKGEVVWSQDDIRRAGGVATVEAMRKGLSGYSGGGVVGQYVPLRAPRMPDLRALAGRSASGIKVDVGVSVDEGGNLQAYVKSVSQDAAAQGIQRWSGSTDFKMRTGAVADQRIKNPRGGIR